MKAVWVNTREEWEAHKAAGHRIEITAIANIFSLEDATSDIGGGGWIMWRDDYEYDTLKDCMKMRAFVPAGWNGFADSEPDCGEGFDIEGIAALAAHYGVDITLTTKLGTIHIKSNTKFADD